MILSKKQITKALISVDAHAGLGLCCSQTPWDRFFRVEAFIISVLFWSLNVLFQNKRSWRLQIKEIQLLWGLKLRVRTQKNIFLISQPKQCCVYSKEPSQWDGSFEHPKHKFKVMGKKIFTFLHSKILFIYTCGCYCQENLKRQISRWQCRMPSIFPDDSCTTGS